jgi:hypothetical protein
MRQRIKGIGKAAKALGVTQTHLSLVLHGHRDSKPLVRRYEQLRADQIADEAPAVAKEITAAARAAKKQKGTKNR